MKKLLELANVVRSKNAGPFEVTMDIIFKDHETFQKAKGSQIITPEHIASLYSTDVSKITAFVWFEPANAVKITMLRVRPSGRMGDYDVYGAQQHAPLLTLEFPF